MVSPAAHHENKGKLTSSLLTEILLAPLELHLQLSCHHKGPSKFDSIIKLGDAAVTGWSYSKFPGTKCPCGRYALQGSPATIRRALTRYARI